MHGWASAKQPPDIVIWVSLLEALEGHGGGPEDLVWVWGIWSGSGDTQIFNVQKGSAHGWATAKKPPSIVGWVSLV